VGDVKIQVASRDSVAGIARLECALGRLSWDKEGVSATLFGRQNGGFVALKNDLQIGHLLYSHVVDEMEILTVAVEPQYRRQGVGHRLMGGALAMNHVGSVHLEVRESNNAAQGLYRALGFLPVGRRAGYYEDGEDALLMRLITGVAGDGS
jgi:[ribosomal protein S18]-alanine N-acetyltransferase